MKLVIRDFVPTTWEFWCDRLIGWLVCLAIGVEWVAKQVSPQVFYSYWLVSLGVCNGEGAWERDENGRLVYL